MKKFIVLALVVFIAGCQAYQRLPETQSTLKNGSNNFQVTVPGGWVQFIYGGDNSLIITKDGLSLQTIHVSKRSLDKPFEYLEVKLKGNALISEVAEHFIANVKAASPGTSVEKEMLQPQLFAGKDGFKLSLKAASKEGLESRMLVFGMLTDQGIYTVSYKAPVIYFFDKELQEFENIASSFEIIEKG